MAHTPLSRETDGFQQAESNKPRKYLRVKCIPVHEHEYFPIFVELELCKIKSEEPLLFSRRCFAWFQVMSSARPPATEQLRVMLESGSTLIGLVYWHPIDEEQEDFISHLMSAADNASVDEKNVNLISSNFNSSCLPVYVKYGTWLVDINYKSSDIKLVMIWFLLQAFLQKTKYRNDFVCLFLNF